MKKLIIFDIDGTLTDSTGVDDEVSLTAMMDVFGIDASMLDWEELKSITSGTDTAMSREIIKLIKSKYPADEELALLKSRFIELLGSRFDTSPHLFREIPGSARFFDQLANYTDFALGIATGSWHGSGIIKLKSIGIDGNSFPYSNSDRHDNRTAIIRDVISEALKNNDGAEFESITYFGDGIWDLKSTIEAGINFIGVDNNLSGLLRSAGAERIINNYLNFEEVYKHIR